MSERAGDLSGRVAIVTGAGSGVGRATALRLADAGAKLVLIGRRRDMLEETAASIGAADDVLIAPADVADEVAIDDIVARAVARFGGVDVVIHAAGVGLYGAVERYSLAAWERTIATNLTGVFLLSRAVIPSLRARGGGAMIAIASGAGKQGYAELAAYSASKFGLIGFMQSLAAEVGDDGIKVSTIVPGSILTEFGGRGLDEKRAAIAAGKRYLEPDDIAEAALFLLRQPKHAWTQELNLWPV